MTCGKAYVVSCNAFECGVIGIAVYTLANESSIVGERNYTIGVSGLDVDVFVIFAPAVSR